MQVVSHVVFLWIGIYVAHNEKINTFRYRSSIPSRRLCESGD